MIAVLGLSLLALALRLFHLTAVSLRGDESFTALFSAGSLLEIVGQLRTIEPHPPLYYLLLYATTRLVGDSEFAVRFPSVLFGMLLVPLSYVAARRAVGTAIALPTALLVAINPFLLWHSQDARNYTLVPLLALGATYFAVRLLRGADEDRDRGAWIGLGASQGLLLLSHYAGAYFVAVLNLVAIALVLGDPSRLRPAALLRGRQGRWLLAQALTALVALPWWFYARRIILTREIDWVVQLDPLTQAQRTFAAYSLGPIELGDALAVLLAPFAVGLTIGAISLGRTPAGRAALACLATPLVVAFAVSLGRASFVDRYFVFVVPIYACALAAGAVTLWRGSKVAGLLLGSGLVVASLYALGLYYFDPSQAKAPDWRGAAREVAAGFQPGDVLLVDTLDPTVAYYARREVRSSSAATAWAEETLPPATAAKEQTSRLAASLAERDRIWLLPTSDGGLDPDGRAVSWLDAAATRMRSWRFGGLEVRLYATPRSTFAAASRPSPRSFALGSSGARIEFLGADLARDASDVGSAEVSLRPGESFWLSLYFRTTGETPADLRVFNHLLDGAGDVRGQHDGSPAGGKRPTYSWRAGDIVLDRHEVRVSEDAPAGSYRVRSGLYDPTSLQRLPLLDEAGSPADDAVETAGITVTGR